MRQSGGPASRFSEGPGRFGQDSACAWDTAQRDDVITTHSAHGRRSPQRDVAPLVTRAAGHRSAGRTEEEQRQSTQTGSSNEEGELSDDPQEAAVVSGQMAGGSSRLRQPGKNKVSDPVTDVPMFTSVGRASVGSNVQGTLGGEGGLWESVRELLHHLENGAPQPSAPISPWVSQPTSFREPPVVVDPPQRTATSVVAETQTGSDGVGGTTKTISQDEDAEKVRLADAARCEVYVCFEEPLGAHLKKEVREKIWKDEFVEIFSLLR